MSTWLETAVEIGVIIFARICCVAIMLPREVELESEMNRSARG